jgi:cysteine desulfurase
MLGRVQTLYLDNAATTPLAPAVRAAMLPFLEAQYGNPSSRHRLGVAAGRALEEARARVARACGAEAEGVLFTSGGTEANNLAVLGLARARRRAGKHVLIGATEHPCVRDPALALGEEGFEVETLALDGAAQLDLADLERKLRPDTVLVACMAVNNEFGTIYPLARLARLVRARAPEACVHADAVQALGKVELSLAGLGVHSLAISAHKVHGPKGAGALVLASGVRPRPLVFGGGQERGLRSGTENVAGIVGLGVAATLAEEGRAARWQALCALQAELARGLEAIPGARLLFRARDDVSPAIAALCLPGPPAEVWMHHLEERGILTSVGSACHAKRSEISPALRALGLSESEARQVLRLSFAGDTGVEAVRRTCGVLAELERSFAASALSSGPKRP